MEPLFALPTQLDYLAVAQSACERRGYVLPQNKVCQIFADALYQFSAVRKINRSNNKQQLDAKRQWLMSAPPEQNYWLRYCQVIPLFWVRQIVVHVRNTKYRSNLWTYLPGALVTHSKQATYLPGALATHSKQASRYKKNYYVTEAQIANKFVFFNFCDAAC